MKTHKISVPMILVGALLAVGTLACAQEPSREQAEAKDSAKPEAASAVVPAEAPAQAEAASQHAEPNAEDWKTKLQVKMALLEKLGLDSMHVDVTASDGAVSLSGTVAKRETKELAETIAQSIPAVTSVRNDVRLESNFDNPNKAGVAVGEAEAELKDAMLSTEVRLALVDGLGSDGFRIGTEVANGLVTLEFAPELAATRRSEAIQAADSVEGVTKVISVEKS